MRPALRALTIARVMLQHRLDTLGAKLSLPLALRWPLRLLALLPAPRRTRGERLRLALEALGPVFVKFGQMLSTRPDLIPSDICAELQKLQDTVPPFPGEEFTALIEAALGAPVDQLFAEFERMPLASASVAQVHAALLADGREVVVKAIRPGVQAVIELDCALLLALARGLERFSAEARRLRPVEVARDYRATIIDELDLQREAANAAILRRNFADSPLLYVPAVHWPLSNQRVMVMERIRAIPVTDVTALRAAGVDFRVLAERGVEIFFTQVFTHNFFHADMHPGNIFVDVREPRRPSYVAVDCAVIGILSDSDQYYLARNMLAIFRRDYRQVAELHLQSGWVPEGTPVVELESAVRTVCEPRFQRPLKDISLAYLLIDLFRVARRFDAEIQPSLVLLQKTLLNIEGLGRQLYPDLDLWQTAHPFLERWLRERFKPTRLLERLKRHGPESLEQFPQVPQLMFDALKRVEGIERVLRERAHTEAPSGRRNATLGALCVGTAAGMLFAASPVAADTLKAASLALAGFGVLLLLARRSWDNRRPPR
ncbi:MAG: ubiquinone biosynthesis regulatory protein kinase UbiB [Gammaproteobacteria bacterium]